ncbi:MAG: nucleoside deaminase [Spirochaetes bacterium]|nr:nucleoside deaminase [Spirochaetota bacterium]
MNDEGFMRAALHEAEKAFSEGEIPVGAVIVLEGSIIAATHNCNRAEQNPTRHAEMIAIERAAAAVGNERLLGCTLYATKEPCAMCAGAIIHARIGRLVIGARDARFGACGTVFSVCGDPRMNHVPEISFGLLADESARMLQDFFRLRRG